MAIPNKELKGSGLKFYRLTQEDIATIMPGAEEYKELSLQETRDMMDKALGGRSISDLIIEMRRSETHGDEGDC